MQFIAQVNNCGIKISPIVVLQGTALQRGFVIGLLEFHFAMAHDHALC